MASKLARMEELLYLMACHKLVEETRPAGARTALERDLSRARKQLFVPGSTGLSIGWRVRAGAMRRELCLKVHVVAKRPPEELERAHLLPAMILVPSLRLDVPVDVEESGELELLGGGPVAAPDQPAMQGGELVRHSQAPDFGALSCMVRSTANPHQVGLLSCSHVIALNGLAAPGSSIDWARLPPASPVASLLGVRQFDLREGASNVDAAIGGLGRNPPPFLPGVQGLGPIAGFRTWDSLRDATDPGGPEPVRMFSPARQRVVGGAVVSKRFSLVMPFPDFRNPTSPLMVPFQQQLICNFPVLPRDSGSVLMDPAGNLVGLVFGRRNADRSALANPIDLVLGTFGVRPA